MLLLDLSTEEFNIAKPTPIDEEIIAELLKSKGDDVEFSNIMEKFIDFTKKQNQYR